MSIWYHSLMVLFNSFISLLVLYPCWYILLYPCWNIEVPHLFAGVFLFSLLNICFVYFELVLFCVYTEELCILGKWILLSLCNATLSLIIFLFWSIIYVIFFSFLFIHVFLVCLVFYPFSFNLSVSLYLKWNSYRQYIVGSLFYLLCRFYCICIVIFTVVLDTYVRT